MRKLITNISTILLLGTVLTMSGCGWGAWHGHGHRNAGPENNWHGPQYGYNHYNGCGHFQ